MSGQDHENNRLIGWLVSYGLDEQGFSYEIRAGLSFVSANEMGEFRLLSLEDKSVSSPHAAMKACPKHTLRVQDIFSEHGSYILRDGETEESIIDGATEVRHGDWIRFGDSTRFQVCLINGAGN